MSEWNKRAVFFFAILILTSIHAEKASAQAIYWENGLSFSKVGKEKRESNYFTGVGVHYLTKEYFFLSSGLGFQHRGVKFEASMAEGVPPVTLSDKYITMNTLFNVKKTVQHVDFYIGVGPEVSFYLNNKAIPDQTEFFNSTLFGLHCTTGIRYTEGYWIGGVNFHYQPGLTSVTHSMKLKDKTLAFGASVGYRF